MENYKNRLQFVHHDGLFSTREDAMKYVNGQLIQIDRPALYAEPMVLKYGDATNPNIILAIGSVGDGHTLSTNNKVFFIDFANIEESIANLKDNSQNVVEGIANLKELVAKFLTSCGIESDGTYTKDYNDEVLKFAENLKHADSLLSQALQEEIARAKAEETKLTLYPQDSTSIAFGVDRQQDGTSLTADVKLSNGKVFDNIQWSNIILHTEDGLFANVDVKYEEDKLQVSINGETKSYELPKETYLESGYYDKESESIVLVLNNGNEVYVDVVDLIEEWGVATAQKSPIMLTKEHVKYSEQAHDNPVWRDILSADVRIKDGDNNILENVLVSDEDGTFALYVNGVASNIKCHIGGQETTVQDALNNIKHPVSTNDNNLIVERGDGLYATVGLNYDKASNVLYFEDGIHPTKAIELNSASILESVSYELGNLVLRFRMTDNTTNEVRIPIAEIVKDFEFDNANRTVTLVRTEKDGQYYMSADVNVSKDADNILQVSNNELYVKGIASNIKYNNTTVADELTKINATEEVEGSIKYEVAKEKAERVANVNELMDLNSMTQTELDSFETSVSEEFIQLKNVDNTLTNELNGVKENVTTLVANVEAHKVDFQAHKDENVASFTLVDTKLGEMNNALEMYKVEATNALNETKTEVKKYADDMMAEAKAYADGLSVNYDGLGSAQKALEDAKTYAEDNIVEAIKKSFQYTDAELVKYDTLIKGDMAHAIEDASKDMKVYVDENDNAILISAKAYTDAKAAAEKFSVTNTDTIALELSDDKVIKGNVKVNLAETNILKVNENGLIANVQLSYDPITSKLIFDNGLELKEWYLTANSLVSDARYDENGKLILVITKADGTTEEVNVQLDKLEGGKAANSPIIVNVEQTQEGVKKITATLDVSTNENNLIVANDGSLFASKVASDHVGTYRDNEMTMQEALGKIAMEIDEAAQSGGNAEEVTLQIAALNAQVNTLQNNLATESAARLVLETKVTELENQMNELKELVNQLTNTSLIDFGTYGETPTE